MKQKLEEQKFEGDRKLSKERSVEIVQKFKEKGFGLEENEEYFIARIERDGKEITQYFPKWEKIDLKGGGSVSIEDDIEKFLKDNLVIQK